MSEPDWDDDDDLDDDDLDEDWYDEDDDSDEETITEEMDDIEELLGDYDRNVDGGWPYDDDTPRRHWRR